MYPHRIRLRGPWDYEPLARLAIRPDGVIEAVAGPLPSRGQMMLPCRWGEGGLADFAGRVRFRRRFGWLARLEPHERVWLTFAGVHSSATVWLNGQLLGTHDRPPSVSPPKLGGDTEGGPFEFEVTSLLKPPNELIVVVEAPAGNGGLWGEVAVEIRQAVAS